MSLHKYLCFSDYKLVSRIINGQTTGRYKDVNYDNLKAITKLKSVSGEQSLKKVETISDRNKEKKNINFLKQHRKCWKKELVRLKNFYESVVYELNLIKANLPWQDSSVRDFFVGVKEYEDSINKDLVTFSYNSVKPVWDLIEDIHDWLLQAKGSYSLFPSTAAVFALEVSVSSANYGVQGNV